jgi:hypothetical protein
MSLYNINQLPDAGTIVGTDLCTILRGSASNDQTYSAVLAYYGGSTALIVDTDTFLIGRGNSGKTIWATGTQLKAFIAGSEAFLHQDDFIFLTRSGQFMKGSLEKLKNYLGVATQFYGLRNLAGFKQVFADAKAGLINLKIIPIGDSNMEYDAHSYGFVNSLLTKSYLIYGQGEAGLGGQGTNFGIGNWGGFMSDTWPSIGLSTWDKRSLNLYEEPSSAANQYYNMASYHHADGSTYEQFRYVDIYYIAQSGGGTFEYGFHDDADNSFHPLLTIDTSILTGAGTGGWKKATYDYGNTSYRHQLYLKVVTQSTNGCILLHLITRNESGAGIKFLKFGHNGAASTNYATAMATTMWREMFYEVSKVVRSDDRRLVILNLGTNDNRGSVTAANYKAYMKSIIASIRAVIPDCPILIYAHPFYNTGSWGGSSATNAAYLAKLLEIVDEDRVAVFDLSTYGNLAAMISAGYYLGDQLHWSSTFTGDFTTKLLNALNA